MPESSFENQSEEADLFSGEEADSLEGLPVPDVDLDENEDALIIRKSKRTDVDGSIDGTEEVNIYRGKGSEDEVVDAFAHLLDDPDYSEKISTERLFNLLAKEEYGLTKEELKMVMDVAEIDDDGLVDYRELSKIFLK